MMEQRIRRMNDAITPFTLAVPQADLEDLNRRIDQTPLAGRRGDSRRLDPGPPRSPRSRRWSITGVTATTGAAARRC